LAKKQVFKINDRVNIYSKKDDTYYKAFIWDIDDSGIIINQPIEQGKGLRLVEGDKFEINIESGDALYYFTGNIIDVKKGGPTPLYVIEYPKKVRRKQRRQYYRLPCNLEVEYEVLKEGDIEEQEGEGGKEGEGEKGAQAAQSEESGEQAQQEQQQQGESQEEGRASGEASGQSGEDDGPNINLTELSEDDELYNPLKALEDKVPTGSGEDVDFAITVDISGGGVQIITSKELNPGAELAMRIFIPDIKGGLKVKARVIRVVPIKVEGAKKYRVAMAFEDLDERLREHIIKFVFDESRRRLKS